MMTISKTLVPLIKGIDLSTRKLPLIKVDSGKPGPIIWLTAAIHGDEVTGISIIHSLLAKIQNYPLLKGTIFAIPIMNPAGFETISRREPFDETDLNRQFPGDPHGTTAERQAYIIAQTIIRTKPTYVIDLHTDSVNSVAYTIVDKVIQSSETTIKTIHMTQTLGFPWAFDRATSEYNPEKTLAGNLMLNNIPAVTIELGGPMVVDEYFRKKGLDAIWKFFQALEMVPSKTKNMLVTDKPRSVYVFQERVHCDSTGIVDYRVKPGETFTKDQILGKIRNIYGKEIEIIRAPSTGILFSHEDQSIAFPGQDLFTYAKKYFLTDIFHTLG